MYTPSLTKDHIRSLYFRLSQCLVTGGRLAALLAVQRRMLTLWPEMAPSADPVLAATLAPDTKRPLPFSREEAGALADSFLRLLNSDSIVGEDGAQIKNALGNKMMILSEAALVSPEIEKWLLARLAQEPVPPFLPDAEFTGDVP